MNNLDPDFATSALLRNKFDFDESDLQVLRNYFNMTISETSKQPVHEEFESFRKDMDIRFGKTDDKIGELRKDMDIRFGKTDDKIGEMQITLAGLVSDVRNLTRNVYVMGSFCFAILSVLSVAGPEILQAFLKSLP